MWVKAFACLLELRAFLIESFTNNSIKNLQNNRQTQEESKDEPQLNLKKRKPSGRNF